MSTIVRKMSTPRDLTPVTDWKNLAFMMYRKSYGRRCTNCSEPVEAAEAVLYMVDGLDEVILVHEKCQA